MKSTVRLSALVSVLLISLISLQAEVKLPAIVSSNMVLQRNTTVVLWGWADPNEQITIEASWLYETIELQADDSGDWKVEVQTSGSKAPQSLIIKDGSKTITLENIVFGEVWICSGQSNMQQPVNGYKGQPTFGSLETITKAKNPDLRLFTVERVGSKTPLEDLEKYIGWQEANPGNVADFSAVAYFFGQELQAILDVPVGMIHTSWGGSSVQAWISKEVMNKYDQVDLKEVDIDKRTNHIPTALFNAMINPLIPYTIKGALWYQGESNRMEPKLYETLFPAMVSDWRSRWGIGDFPFYYAQIAPYWYNDTLAYSDANNSAFIRESQLKCQELIPNSGMAVTLDIGDKFCIHPPKKKEVADRMLYHALNQTYGMETVDSHSPVYREMEIRDDKARLTFSYAENGLYAKGDLKGFEIAGEDRVFYPADAMIAGRDTVVLSSAMVTSPKAVRYCWDNWVVGSLFDTYLLPASSFRTDDWEDARRPIAQ